MGVITLTLIAANYQPSGSGPALWVILACGLAIGLGTYMGGWRIMRTVGKKISDVQSPQGFAARRARPPRSWCRRTSVRPLTTHVTSGSVIGSGLGKKLADVHWSVVGRIVVAWVITLPAAAVVGALATAVAATSTVGLVVVAVLALVADLGFFVLARASR